MATTTLKPLTFAVAHTRPTCRQAVQHIAPRGYTLVSYRGKAQEIVNVSYIGGRSVHSYHIEGTRHRIRIPVVCVVARDE